MRAKPILTLPIILAALTLPSAAQTSNTTNRQAEADAIYAEGRLLADGKGLKRGSDDEVRTRLGAAVTKFSAAQDIYREIGNRKKEGKCLSEIGSLYSRMDQDQKGIDFYLQAVAIFREIKDQKEVSFVLGNLGNAYSRAQSFAKAIEAYQEALAIAKETGDRFTQALALEQIGNCFKNIHDMRKSLEFWTAALALFQELGEKNYEAELLTNIGGLYMIMGDYRLAKEWLDKSLDFQKKNRFKYQEGHVLGMFGLLYDGLNEKQKSLEYFQNKLSIEIELNDPDGAASTRKQMAGIYVDLGQKEKAVRLLNDLLAVYRTLKRRALIASTLRELAEILGEDKESAESAKNYLMEALDLAKQINYKSEQAEILLELGTLHSRAFNDESQALKFKTESVGLFISIGAVSSVANGFYQIGLSHWYSKSIDKAFGYFVVAWALARYTGSLPTEASALIWVQNAAFSVGGPRLTILYGKLAVNTFQLGRSKAASFDKESQRAYLRSYELVYRRLAEQLLNQDRVSEAHQVLQSFKDQQSYDSQDSAIQPAFIDLTPEEEAFAEAIEKAGDTWAHAFVKFLTFKQSIDGRTPTAEEKEKDRANAAAISVAESSTVEAIGISRPLVTGEVKPILTQDTVQMQATLKKLGEQLHDRPVIIYQYLGNGAYYSLVITPTEIKKVSAPSNFYVTSAAAQKFWALLQSDNYDPRAVGKELYDIVFRPIEKELPAGTKTILWSLDGNLRYIPMGALYDGKQYLVERYNNVTFTRADGGRLTGPVSAKWSASAFGSAKPHAVEVLGNQVTFGALPGVRSELDNLFAKTRPHGVMDGDILMDDAFSRENMLARLTQKRPVVHIASHFSFRPGDETRSFLLLGDGTPFTLADMKKQKDMFAGVELLTLSACNTAAQQADANGREVDAFFELAQRLGAQSVLATLWPVADNSTPWLMRQFYDLKVNKNQNKAEALRNAQLALLNGSAKASRSATRTDASAVKIIVADAATARTETRADQFVIEKKDAKPYLADPKKPFAHPFYWSPFVLIGNWR